jgi:signal transduction histidine kinase
MDGQATITEPAGAATDVAPQRIDYARRIDELGKIIVTYNDITARLQQSHEQLTATVVRLRAELSEKNRLLERRNRLAAVGEMAAGMAHEIRNPLGGIQLYASLLAKDVADRRESLELVRKISGGVKRLEGIVGQVLQFSRDVNIQPVEVDLAHIIEQAAEYATQSMTDRNVCCTIKGPRPMPVKLDPLLFGQAVLNLLLNAAEAVERNGKVTVSYGPPPAGAEARQFHLAITDNGPGIPPGVLDRIFNPFFTTKDTGTGLGLAIVHRVIEAHDGAIIAQNVPGGGARFEIRI